MQIAGPDATLTSLDDALLEFLRLLQHPAYRRRLRAGLSTPVELSTVRTLRAVQRNADQPSIGAIANGLSVDPSTASRMVDRVVADGFASRRPTSQDRRRVEVELTDSGERLLAEATAVRREVLAEVTADWPQADVELLVQLLQRLHSAIDEL